MIAEEQNISRAAEKLYISQPSLSKFLLNLEEAQGVRLFTRNRNMLEITGAGEIYLHYARRFLELEDQMTEEMEKVRGAEEKNISLGITPWISSYITFQLMDAFAGKYPQIRLDIVEDFGENLFSMFLDRKLDMVFSNLTEETKARLPKNGRYLPMRQDKLLLTAAKSISRSYGIDAGRTSAEHPYQLREIPFTNCNIITGKPHQHLYSIIRDIIGKYELHPRSVIESQNTDNCLHLVDSGHGISFVSEIYVKNSPHLKNSDIFSIDDPVFDYTRFIIYDTTAQTPAREELIRMIQDICRRI